MRVCECWADCLKQDLQDFLGFSEWRGPEGTGVLVREIVRVCECWADCLKQDLQDFFGIFGMAGVPLTQVRSYERLRALYDRSREITSVHERLRRVFLACAKGNRRYQSRFASQGGPAGVFL